MSSTTQDADQTELDLESPGEVKEAFENLQDKIEELESRVDYRETSENIHVQGVETEKGDRIKLQQSKERWLSINYLEKVLQDLGYEIVEAENGGGGQK